MDNDQEYTKFRERLSYICTTYRDRDAITYMLDSGGKQIYSFADVERIVQGWEEAFSGFGLLRGDRAAIISPASPRVILAALALARAGITTVMIDAALPEEEIKDRGSRCLIWIPARKGCLCFHRVPGLSSGERRQTGRRMLLLLFIPLGQPVR